MALAFQVALILFLQPFILLILSPFFAGVPMSSPIRFEIHDRIATLTLNRPDKLNALVPEMREGFEEALAKAAGPGVKALFLRGAGRAFCAGGDIGWMAQALSEQRWGEMEALIWAPRWRTSWRPCPSRWWQWCRARPPERA